MIVLHGAWTLRIVLDFFRPSVLPIPDTTILKAGDTDADTGSDLILATIDLPRPRYLRYRTFPLPDLSPRLQLYSVLINGNN